MIILHHLLSEIFAASCSRGNLAANLNRAWFTVEERKISNVRGKNKKQLSPNRMQKIYDAVYEMFPFTHMETEKASWSECVKAIDCANQQLKARDKEI